MPAWITRISDWVAFIHEHGHKALAMPDGTVQATSWVRLADGTMTAETSMLRTPDEVLAWLGY